MLLQLQCVQFVGLGAVDQHVDLDLLEHGACIVGQWCPGSRSRHLPELPEPEHDQRAIRLGQFHADAHGHEIDASTAGSCDNSGASCSLVDNSGTWSIKALGQSSFDFGTDTNAHVQPDGAYHYHGMPEGFITKRLLEGSQAAGQSMTLIGWASDGFPIYARYGYTVATDASSALKIVTGSRKLITTVPTTRPATSTYALGTFKQDWEYVAGSGDPDKCNGPVGVTRSSRTVSTTTTQPMPIRTFSAV